MVVCHRKNISSAALIETFRRFVLVIELNLSKHTNATECEWITTLSQSIYQFQLIMARIRSDISILSKSRFSYLFVMKNENFNTSEKINNVVYILWQYNKNEFKILSFMLFIFISTNRANIYKPAIP